MRQLTGRCLSKNTKIRLIRRRERRKVLSFSDFEQSLGHYKKYRFIDKAVNISIEYDLLNLVDLRSSGLLLLRPESWI